MTTLYLTASILFAFMMTCDIFILIHPHISIKKYPIFFLSFSALSILQIHFDFSSMLFVSLAINSILLVKFSKKIYSIIYIPFGYIVNCILMNLLVFTWHILWAYPIEKTNTSIFFLIVSYILTILATCPVLYLVRLLIQKYIIHAFEKMNKKLLSLIAFTILLCAFLIFMLACILFMVDLSDQKYFMLISLLILYFLLTISMILIVLYTTKKNYEAQKKVEYLENLNEYTRNLELVYNNLRSFKHDYVNIMTSLAAYIDEKRYDELETFFYEHILPMQKNLTQKNGALNNLLHVHVLELKSILYTKLLLAVNQDIEVNLDIPDDIDSINIDPVDLTRMLGIYLDNAIEACLETEHPTINFHLGKMNQDIILIISNTFVDKGLSVAQMYKKEVTTKGDGHGIGLHNVSQILNRYDNIYHETLMEDGLFIQQVQIS